MSCCFQQFPVSAGREHCSASTEQVLANVEVERVGLVVGNSTRLHMIFLTEHDGFGAQIENDIRMMHRGFEFHCLGVTNKT